MPTNNTGTNLIVGPDVNGEFFDVAPGDDYDLPEPPRSASSGSEEAPAEEEAPSAPEKDLGDAKSQPPAKATPKPDDTTPPADVPPADSNQEGASA